MRSTTGSSRSNCKTTMIPCAIGTFGFALFSTLKNCKAVYGANGDCNMELSCCWRSKQRLHHAENRVSWPCELAGIDRVEHCSRSGGIADLEQVSPAQVQFFKGFPLRLRFFWFVRPAQFDCDFRTPGRIPANHRQNEVNFRLVLSFFLNPIGSDHVQN